ncbi:MAG: response regulator, partial [Gammaproteobacteria bacterium]
MKNNRPFLKEVISRLFVVDFTSIEARQYLIVFIFSTIGICAFSAFGIDAFLRGKILFGCVLFLGNVLTIFTVFYLRRTGNVLYAAYGIVIVLFFICLFLIINVAPYDRTAPMWLYLFPLTSLFALGHRKGLLFNIVLISTTLILMLFLPALSAQYNFFYLSRYFSTLAIVVLLSYVFEFAREKTFQAFQVANQAEQVAEAKSEFLSNMSHELRTPMNAIVGLSKVLITEIKETRHLNYLKQIDQSSKSLLEIIDDILKFSDLEKGRFVLDIKPLSIECLLDEVVDLFRGAAENKGLVFTVKNLSDADLQVNGDRACLKKILSNLIDNAIKFTGTGEVCLSVETTQPESDKAKLRFSVKDTGKGLTEDELSNIFDCFSQSDTSSTRSFGGLGLGLSTAKKLSNLVEGEIEVKSTLGQGSEFCLTVLMDIAENKESIEAFQSDEVKDVCERAAMQAESDEVLSMDYVVSKLAGTRWLVAEDNFINLMVIQEFLQQAAIEMVLKENGKEALEAFEKEQFDAVLTDIQMPEMDGFGLTDAIRNRDDGKDIPIIAITAHSMHGYRERCLEAGMSDYLTKPVDQNELYRVMISHLVSVSEVKHKDSVAGSTEMQDTEFDLFSDTLAGAGIDVSKALHKLGGNWKLFQNMLLSFQQQYDDADQQLIKEFDVNSDESDENALRLIHTVKGLAGSIAANKLHKKSIQLESAMKSVSPNISL